jgi:hypothetical protein
MRLKLRRVDITFCDINDSASGFERRKAKGEVRREPVGVAFHLLFERHRPYSIEFGEIAVEHDLLAAYHIDVLFNRRDRDHGGSGRGGSRRFLFLRHVSN